MGVSRFTTPERKLRNITRPAPAIRIWSSCELCGFGHRLHSSEQENIRRDAHEKNRRRRHERPCKGLRGLDDVARHNGSGNRSKLIAKIQYSTHGTDTFFRRNQRRNRPADRSRGGQSPDRDADPEERTRGALSVGRAKDPKAETGP